MSREMPIVYPVYDTVPPSNPSSNGSYGSVFIVLAVIVTVSAFACFLGRLCNKRHNAAKPSPHNLPPKEKDAKRFQTKDGDIEFGYDKRFASSKVAATGDQSTMHRPPGSMGPNSFREPAMGGPAESFHQKSNKVGPNSFREPAMMGRPVESFHQESNKVGPHLFREPAMGRPAESFHQPAMRRPDSFHEPTMERPNSFDKGEYEGDHQVRFDVDRDNKLNLNFKPRTRPQRY